MRAIAAAALLVSLLPLAASAAGRTEFWNLTSNTITRLALAPAGAATFGPNQCSNDKDGSVDHDERLKLAGVQSGYYDVQVTDQKGRACIARNVAVDASKRVAFSLSDHDLKECHGP